MGALWRSIGFTSGARIYALLASSVSLIISARALGPEGRGAVAAAVTWALLFATIGYLSLGQVAIHRAAGKPVPEWLGTTLAALVAMTASVSVVGWAVAAVIYLVSGGDAYGKVPVYALVLGFATLPFLVWEQYGSSLLTAVGKINIYNRAEIIGRTLGVLLVILLVGALAFGVAGALVALLLAQAVVAGLGSRYLIRLAGRGFVFERSALRELLVGGAKLHFNAIGTFLFANASVLIVQSIRGPAETGAFQVVVQLMTVGLLIPQAASMVLYGEVARDGPDRAWAANRRVLFAMTALMTVAVVAGYLLAPTLIPLIFGDDFESAVPVFQILVFGLIGQTFSAVMAPQWIGRGLFWQASALTLAVGLTNVVACVFLVDAYGMKGAAYSLLGVYTVSVVGNGFMAVWVNRKAASAASR
jgi:O-antigen/teichoic acid export membrane protein